MARHSFASSLRWTSLGWHGLVLVGVLTVFGLTLHLRMRQALFTRVDAALVDRAHVIAAALELDVFTGWELSLDETYFTVIARTGYYDISSADGTFVRRGGESPASLVDSVPGFRDVGDQREYARLGLKGSRIRVGQSVAAERAELRRVLAFTAAAGLAVLGLALVGGWWISTRSLRPIERMSRAAGSITERDLTQRVDVESVPVELRDLAATLNATFARLEAAFAQQARFTADASHELRTPLAIVRAQAEHALRRERSVEEYRAAFTACLRSTTRMAHIVEQLLSLARNDAGEMRITRVEIQLDDIVGEAVLETRAEAASAGVEVSSNLRPARVQGDAVLLHEVVLNLVTNAIRYNRPGGHVRLTLETRDDRALLSVEDDGDGIPSTALPHLFERFFRVDPARSRERGGSGLGLSISRSIVEAHGGSIAVASRAGLGSVFTVSLPVSIAARG